jgi:hypothetical protein
LGEEMEARGGRTGRGEDEPLRLTGWSSGVSPLLLSAVAEDECLRPWARPSCAEDWLLDGSTELPSEELEVFLTFEGRTEKLVSNGFG